MSIPPEWQWLALPIVTMLFLVLKLKRLKVVVKGSEKEHLNKSRKLLTDIDREILVHFYSYASGIFTKDGALRLLSLKL